MRHRNGLDQQALSRPNEVLGKGSEIGSNFLIWYSKAPIRSSPIIVLKCPIETNWWAFKIN